MEIHGKVADGDDAGKDEEADKCEEMEGDNAPLVSIENFCIFLFYYFQKYKSIHDPLSSLRVPSAVQQENI